MKPDERFVNVSIKVESICLKKKNFSDWYGILFGKLQYD